MPASLSLQPSKLGIGLPLQPSKLHPKLVKALYHRDRIPASRHPQIAGFTARARRQAYQAQIRDLKTQYGYADTPVTLRDPAVLEQIATDASQAATSIISGYNSRLQTALDTLDGLHKLHDTLSENDALLQPFRQGITDYNQDTLIPFQLKTARQVAIHDFMVNNGIQALYLVEPDYSVSPDEEICQQALAISNATDGKGAPFSAYAELSDGGFMGSEHPGCPHLLVPKEADPDTLPAPEDLWDGSEGPEDVTSSEDMGDVSSEKGFVGLAMLRGFGLTTKVFTEALHPRVPAGVHGGGQFTDGSGGGEPSHIRDTQPVSVKGTAAEQASFHKTYDTVLQSLPRNFLGFKGGKLAEVIAKSRHQYRKGLVRFAKPLGLVQKSEERSPEENAAIHAWYGDQHVATAALDKIMTGVKAKYDAVIQKSPMGWGVPTIEGDTPAGRELYASMKAAAESKGYKVLRWMSKAEAGDNGYLDPDKKEIHINPDRPPDQQAKTLAHEVGHAYAEHIGTSNPTLTAKQEIEAETVAFTLAQQHGLDTSDASIARLLGEGSRYSLGYGTNNIHQAIASVADRASFGMKVARKIRRTEVDLKTTKSATVTGPKLQPDEYRYDAEGKLLNPEDFHGCVRSSITSKGLGLHVKYNHDHDELGRFTSGDSGLTSVDDPKQMFDYSSTYQEMARGALNLPHLDIEGDGQGENDPEGTTADEVAQRITAAALAARSRLHPSIVGNFLGAWQAAAYNPTSVAISEAVRQKFNLPQTDAGRQYIEHAKNDSLLLGARPLKLDGSMYVWQTPEEVASSKVAAWDKLMGQARTFVDAQYGLTQETFDQLGYAPTDTMTLYRGMGKPNGQELPNVGRNWTESKITGRGATSWTTEASISENFVGMGGPDAKKYDNNYIVHAKVPIKDILATGFTGLGSMSELEVVVIGGPRHVRAIKDEPGTTIYTGNPGYAKGLVQKYNHLHDELGRFADAAGEPIPAPTWADASSGTKRYADLVRTVHGLRSLDDAEVLHALTPLDKANSLEAFARDNGIVLRDPANRIADWDFKTTSGPSVELAEAAREKFNLPQTPEGAKRLAAVEAALSTRFGPVDFTQNLKDARNFLDAQYAFTQSKLAEAGYKPDDTIVLYRGFGRNYGRGLGLTSDDVGYWKQGVSVNTRGLSSWSMNFDSARSFSTAMYDHPYVMAARVKVSDMVALAGTGLGVTNELEVVVTGGPRTGAIVERDGKSGSNWYPQEPPSAEQQDLEQRYNAWLDTIDPYHGVGSATFETSPFAKPHVKAAHDVSDEARDDHGRWALGSVTAGSIPTYQEGQKAVEDYASTLYERSGGPYPDPYNGPQLTYEGIANSLDLPALNETRGGEIIAGSNGKLSPVEVRAWANAWGRNTGGQEWAALQVATSEKFGIPLGTAEGRVATQAPTRDQIDQARVFVDATYEATQKVLKAQGVDFVDLYRGVGYTDATAPPTYQEAIKDGQAAGPIPNKPLASYAIDPSITEQFGQNYQGLNPAFGPGARPYTLAVRVPRARIFGCAYAGIGVPREGEYVIIGGPTEALVKTRKPHWEKTFTEALHPRDDKGEFTDSAGSLESIIPPALGGNVDDEAVAQYGDRMKALLIGSNQFGDPDTFSAAQRRQAKTMATEDLSSNVIISFQQGWKNDAETAESIALVQAAHEVLGYENNATHISRVTELQQRFKDGPVTTQGSSSASYNSYSELINIAKQYLQVQYAFAQKALSGMGYKPNDTLTLYRGFAAKPDDPAVAGIKQDRWGQQRLNSRAVTSWTVSSGQARDFANPDEGTELNGYVAATQVRVKDILGTGYAGLGQPAELEVVVLNGKRPAWVTKITDYHDA